MTLKKKQIFLTKPQNPILHFELGSVFVMYPSIMKCTIHLFHLIPSSDSSYLDAALVPLS